MQWEATRRKTPAALGRRYPYIPVLRAFGHAFPRLPEEQQARIRRRANTYAGIEMILMGIVLPMGYFVGMTAIWRNRRQVPGAPSTSTCSRRSTGWG